MWPFKKKDPKAVQPHIYQDCNHAWGLWTLSEKVPLGYNTKDQIEIIDVTGLEDIYRIFTRPPLDVLIRKAYGADHASIGSL